MVEFWLRIIPLLAVLTPVLGALLIAWTGQRRANLREFWSVAAGVVMFTLVGSMNLILSCSINLCVVRHTIVIFSMIPNTYIRKSRSITVQRRRAAATRISRTY